MVLTVHGAGCRVIPESERPSVPPGRCLGVGASGSVPIDIHSASPGTERAAEATISSMSPIPGRGDEDVRSRDLLACVRLVWDEDRAVSTDPGASPLLFADLAAHEWSGGAARLTILHDALAVFGDVVLRPAVRAGVLVVVLATAIGTVSSPDGSSRAWVGVADLVDGVDGDRMAALVRDLLDPLLDRVGIGGPRRTVVRRIVAASLASRWTMLARSGTTSADPGWIDRVLETAGYPIAPTRTLSVVADDGPPVTFTVPAVCCVLARRASAGSCPACPRWPSDEDRRTQLIDWLSSVEDDAFHALTGRPRRPTAPTE